MVPFEWAEVFGLRKISRFARNDSRYSRLVISNKVRDLYLTEPLPRFGFHADRLCFVLTLPGVSLNSFRDSAKYIAWRIPSQLILVQFPPT